MSDPKGRTIPLSVCRRLMGDLLHFARKVPSVPVQRLMNIAAVRNAREQTTSRPSWCVIFTKAYARLAGEFPEFRRAFMAFPRQHIYEHPLSVASIALEREYEGENGVFFGQIRSPEEHTLAELDAQLHRFKNEPVWDISLFRRAIRTARAPLLVRRFAWWFGLNSSGHKRAKRMGTFGVTVYSSFGAEGLHPLSPLTTTLNYGVIQPDGTVAVRIIYDHRVMDGATVARALGRLEEIMNSEIVQELRNMQRKKITRAA
jgi:hypothetical protein